VAVLVLDAVAGVTQQDKKIGGQIAEAARGCVIVVNKWTWQRRKSERNGRKRKAGSERRKRFAKSTWKALRRELFFLDWAPVLFVSAKTGEQVNELFAQVAAIEREMARRVDTPELNKLLIRALESYPPPHVHGKRFKILYAFQKPTPPPTLMMFVNDARCLTPHYQRFLVRQDSGGLGVHGLPGIVQTPAARAPKTCGKVTLSPPD